MAAFVARQPILDANQALYGYELLLRAGAKGILPDFAPDGDTGRVIMDTASLVGVDTLTGGRKAFIKISRSMLIQGLPFLLPSKRVVIELAENVEPDPEVLSACRTLKDSGYMLALDDFSDRPNYEPLVELADFLKVDFTRSGPQERQRLAQRYRSQAHLLAEGVESVNDVREGLKLGYGYYQGFFFCNPELISRSDIPGFKANYLRLMQEIAQPDLDSDQIEQILKREVSLSVGILRLLRSAAFGYGDQVSSVQQALSLLGERAVRKWATMITLCAMGEDRPRELVAMCLVRARMCELLATSSGLGRHGEELFLVGMLSLLDAVVGRPMTELLEEMPISKDIRAGLINSDSPLGRVRSLVVAHERANWADVSRLSACLGISERFLPTLYSQAVVWAREVFRV